MKLIEFSDSCAVETQVPFRGPGIPKGTFWPNGSPLHFCTIETLGIAVELASSDREICIFEPENGKRPWPGRLD